MKIVVTERMSVLS